MKSYKVSFYNLYVPGCVEHYLVHIMREHEDFLPELDFVMEVDGHIVGNIMYTKAKLKDEAGQEKEILTFGPLCIKKEYQRKGTVKSLSNIPSIKLPNSDTTSLYIRKSV